MVSARPAFFPLRVVYNRLLASWQYGFLLESLVLREIKVRYRRSFLGIIWTLLNPILMMIIFTAIFSTLFARSVQNFPVYFLSANLAWQVFAQSTVLAMTSMVRGAPLYKRIHVPKYIFVLAAVISDVINYLIALIPLALLLLLVGHPLRPALLFFPVGVCIIVLFTLGVSFIMATICVFFDDITQLYAVILQATMYLTAIFYPIDIVPARFRVVIHLNPMYHMVELVRRPIYYGQLPSAETLLVSTALAFGALALGWTMFSRLSDRFAYYV